MAQSEYINHLATVMHLAACVSTFQINSWSISTTRQTNICLANPYALTVMAVCAYKILINMPKRFFRSLNPKRDIPFSACIPSMAGASGISILRRRFQFTSPTRQYFLIKRDKYRPRPDVYGLDKNVTALLRGEPAVAHIPVARKYGGDSPVRAHALSRHRYEVVEQPHSWDRTRDPYFAGSGGSSYYYGYDRRRSW